AAAATAWSASTMAQICSGDVDHWGVAVSAGTRGEAVVSGFRHAQGDLDLQMLDGGGTSLGTSAGTTDAERVSYCFATAGTAIAQVRGYETSENGYTIAFNTMPDAAMCCSADANEPNDTRAAARALTLAAGRADLD